MDPDIQVSNAEAFRCIKPREMSSERLQL